MLSDRRTRQDLRPLLTYLLLLLAVILIYAEIFHLIMERVEGQRHSWFTGVYWTLTVMSTLGFGDITFQSNLGRFFSTTVLVTGVMLLLVILPFLFIRFFYAPWLERQIQRRSQPPRTVPEETRDHVIICRGDAIADGLMARLRLGGIPHFIIESDPSTATRMREDGVPVILGEVDAAETYRGLRAGDARLILVNAEDTVNTNIVLTIREVAPHVPIAAIAEQGDSIDILELSGATHVVPLKRRLGEHLANRVTAGNSQAMVIGSYHDLLLAEFPVHNTPMAGRTIRETRLREATGVSIVGVWEHGRLQPARPDRVLTSMCVPVVVGTADQVAALDELLIIYDVNENPVLVIGGGKVGRAVTRALKRREVPVHVIERNAELAERFADLPDRLVVGNAADREILVSAGIEAAPTVVLTTNDDAMNVYLAVYCRRLNPESRIVSRITHERNVEAIQRAGADFVLSYASLGVQTALSMIQGHELVVLGEGVDLFRLKVPHSLAGTTLAGGGIGARTGLNVIAIETADRTVTSPPPSTVLREDAVLLVLGSSEQRKLFAEAFH